MAKKVPTPSEYIGKLPPARKEIIERLREILLANVPNCQESMGWGVLCYNDLFYLANLPKQVNLGVSILGLTPTEIKQFQGGGKTMRHLKFNSIADIDINELKKKIELILAKAKPVHK